MDVIRVRAPSELHAQRLLASLDGGFSSGLEQGDDGQSVVAITLDPETATRLVLLFNALGEWLADGELESCQIGFSDRDYTLLAARAGQPRDATEFLLERTIQLQRALDSRVVIEQAKGVLAERHAVPPDRAFEQMRRQARSRRAKIHAVAAEIVASAAKEQPGAEPEPGTSTQ